MLSLVVPVYKNQENLERLLTELVRLEGRLENELEIVFVVDGSPDESLRILRERVPGLIRRSQIVALSRNFGSFNAIMAGMELGRGEFFAVLAADLQEPPELIVEIYDHLRRDVADVVFGYRQKRSDPWLSELSATLFWAAYRRFVVKDIPSGGVDIFGCTRRVRDKILSFSEVSSSLMALLFWVGFRRCYIGYERQPRREGNSAWTVALKLRYCMNSIFNFTDLPLQLLLALGGLGTSTAVVLGAVILISRLTSGIPVPGYTALALMVLFFGSLITLGMGIIGQYVWLCLQNARRRPNYLIESSVICDRPEILQRSIGQSGR